MAGDWIKMSTDLRTHPKVVRISSALKADRFRVIGGLHAVWCLFDAHSVDGSLEGYSLEALDDLIGWPGFSAAMAAVEWINVREQALDLPRFSHHNGQSAKRRAQETDRKRVARASAETSASDADEKRTREEKSREEKKEEETPRKRGAKTCPGDFSVTDEMRQWAATNAPRADWERETEKFRDWEFKDAKTDWVKAWRNWMRKASDNASSKTAGANETPYQRSQREKYEQVAPAIAAKSPGVVGPTNVMEILDARVVAQIGR